MVSVENVSRSAALIHTGRMANNSWTRLRGLIGVRDLPEGQGMVIMPRCSLHVHVDPDRRDLCQQAASGRGARQSHATLGGR